MSKFHEFDPVAVLAQCQNLAQVAFNNTQELAKAHNQQEAFLAELVNQHNEVINIIKDIRQDIQELRDDIS